MKAAEKDVASYKLKRKRVLAQSVISASTAAGVAVGAVPIPIADAAILAPLKGAEVINAIVAGAIVAAMGEGSAHVFEKVSLGEMSAKDLGAIRKFMEGKLDSEFISKAIAIVEDFAKDEQGKGELKSVAAAILKALGPKAV